MGKLFCLTAFILASVSIGLAQNSDNWSGFYFGGNGFVSSDRSEVVAQSVTINQITNVNPPGPQPLTVIPSTARSLIGSKRDTNFGGGGQLGYQWQSGSFVFGAEADYSPFSRTVVVSTTDGLPPTLLSPAGTYTIERRVRVSNESSARARFGFASGKTLFYVTGGYSYGRVRVRANDTITIPAGLSAGGGYDAPAVGPITSTYNPAQNMHGWNAGGGVERRVGKSNSLGFEFRRTDLGSKTFTPESYVLLNPNNTPTAFFTSAPTQASLSSYGFSVRFNFHGLW